MSSLFAAAILAVVATVVAAMNIMNVTAADPVRWTGAPGRATVALCDEHGTQQRHSLERAWSDDPH